MPDLPQQYSEFNSRMSLLWDILKHYVPDVVAAQGKRMVGFLTGWQMPDFRGKRSIYIPEWANAALLGDSACIMESIYPHHLD